MKMKQVVLGLLLTVGSFNYGCIAGGVATALTGVPWYAVGGALVGGGLTAATLRPGSSFGPHAGSPFNPKAEDNWGRWEVRAAAILLDAENEGHQVALNGLPVDASVAKDLNVQLKDIENYNEVDLLQIHQLNAVVEKALEKHSEENLSVAELDQVADKLGFEDAQTIAQVLAQNSLTCDNLKVIAGNMNVSSPKSLEIYFKSRFNNQVKVESCK